MRFSPKSVLGDSAYILAGHSFSLPLPFVPDVGSLSRLFIPSVTAGLLSASGSLKHWISEENRFQ